MRYRRGFILGLGLLLIGAGIYALVVGKPKWDEEKKLEGMQARLAGLGVALLGAACLAWGVFFPRPIWEIF